eukprot:72611-Prymnesium_polylepis.1
MPEPNQTLRGAAARIAPTALGALNSDMPGMMDHAPRFSDCTNRPGSRDARGDVDACEVEVEARDDLDARAVLAVEHVEE